jgi:hypothetical protein
MAQGQIIISAGLKPLPLPHELATARTLADAWHRVVFIQPNNLKGSRTPDIILDGTRYEMKSPTGNLNAIERNLRRALKQSPNIIFDSRRMKLHDTTEIKRHLSFEMRKYPRIRHLLLIDKKGEIVDLNKTNSLK